MAMMQVGVVEGLGCVKTVSAILAAKAKKKVSQVETVEENFWEGW